MPGKMTKSILRPPFRPPRYRQPSAARVYLAGRSEKRKIFTSAPESSGESRTKCFLSRRSFGTFELFCDLSCIRLPSKIGRAHV